MNRQEDERRQKEEKRPGGKEASWKKKKERTLKETLERLALFFSRINVAGGCSFLQSYDVGQLTVLTPVSWPEINKNKDDSDKKLH